MYVFKYTVEGRAYAKFRNLDEAEFIVPCKYMRAVLVIIELLFNGVEDLSFQIMAMRFGVPN